MGEVDEEEDKESHDYRVHRRLTTKQQIIDHVVNGLTFALLDADELLDYQKLRHEKNLEKKEDGSRYQVDIHLSFDLPS